MTVACVGPSQAAAAAAPTAHRVDDTAPLAITIDGLTPGYVPESGRIRISGTIANRDVVPWEGIRLYPTWDSDGIPIRRASGLAAAAELPAEEVVAERILTVKDEIGTLQPGDVAPFTLSVPRSELEPIAGGVGVYWLGVQALGASSTTEDDTVSDGRARTFLPYVPPHNDRTVRTSVVLPLRRPVQLGPAGRVAQRDVWETELSERGDLGRLLAFGAAAADDQATWLVDPAVLDAVRRLARGNPPHSMRPSAAQPDGEDGAEDEQSDGPSAETSSTPALTEEADLIDEELGTARPGLPAAQDWLDALRPVLGDGQVLTLPWGDLDLAAAAEHDPTTYAAAREQPTLLDDWDLSSTPAIAGPRGYLDANSFLLADDDAVGLISDAMVADPETPSVGRVGKHAVAITSTAAASGGPGPDPRLSPVALRQRILSEAALRLGTPDPQPLVVLLPANSVPTNPTGFWSGLEADWLDLGSLSAAVAFADQDLDLSALDYPEQESAAELGESVFLKHTALLEAGRAVQNMLTGNSVVAGEIARDALPNLSYWSRRSPARAFVRLRNAETFITDITSSVEIAGPLGVTLSSDNGSFVVTVTNRLRQPVTVRVEAVPQAGIDVVATGGDVVLAPRGRTTVVIDARATGAAVHDVELRLTDIDGNPLGASAVVPVRSGQVGAVIWWIIGSGVAILFVAITIRLVRRIRGGGATDDDEESGG